MFPDISRDDIFRLETARLWLRWLRASDAAVVASMPDVDNVAPSAIWGAQLQRPGEAERFIFHARTVNAAGSALVLGATSKGKGRTLVGIVGAQATDRGEVVVGCAIAPGQTGRGYAAESLSAIVDACFGLTEARALVARSRDDEAAAARVLEKCGFSRAEPGASGGPDPAAAYHLFRRSRSDWSRKRARRLPDMLQQERPRGPGGGTDGY